jgi:hypothetical protein
MAHSDVTSADMWSYPEVVGRIDMSGYEVEAIDGEIGTVDETTLDADASYVVVDTGPWIFGKKVVIPAGLVERVDRDDEKVYVRRTKDEIRNAPEFDSDRYREADYRDKLGAYYAAGPAQHEEPPDA